jgi:polysaccharide biosynthesis protein PslH
MISGLMSSKRLLEGAASAHVSRRPHLLFLCQTLPYPADSGVHLRSYNILRLLSEQFQVTALCFYRRINRPTKAHLEYSLGGLRALGVEVEAFAIPSEHSKARMIWDHANSLLRSVPYTRTVYYSKAFTSRLKELLETRTFDLVHVDSLDLARYLPLLRGTPVACTHHNVESDLLERRSNYEKSLLKRSYLRHQAELMRTEERLWCSKVALNIVVSPIDGAALRQISPPAKIAVVPNGVDTSHFDARPTVGREIVFVGGYGWFPNHDGMQFFGEHVLPIIRRAIDNVRVTWVGRAPDEIRDQFSQKYGIELTGYVDDVRPFVQRGACYIVPIRAGGGTRLKILDAWAMGKAIVTTAVGCEGLEAVDGVNALVRDTPEDFAKAVIDVLTNDDLRTRLEIAGRRVAEASYDWGVIGKVLADQYSEVLNATAASRL